MKKILAILLVLVVLLSLVGCGDNKAENSSDLSGTVDSATQSGSEDKKQHFGSKLNWKSDIPLSEIREVANYSHVGIYFITNNNELYEYSHVKPFSNDKYEKKLGDIEFSTLVRNSGYLEKVFVKDKEFYLIRNGSLEKTDISEYCLFEKICGYKVSTLFPFAGETCYLRVDENNNFFKYTYSSIWNSEESEYEIKWKESKTNLTIPQGETVLSIIGAVSEGSILKTDKAYYKYGVSNAEEVEKYADVEEEYNWILHKELTAEYDNIKYLSRDYIIYKDEPDCFYSYLGLG